MDAPVRPGAPAYWQCAVRHLRNTDPTLGRLIADRSSESIVSRGDPFVTLARSIVGQQISVKAAQSIWNRLAARYPELTAEKLSRVRPTSLRAVGLSQRKAEYLRDLGKHFRSGAIDPSVWHQADDEDIIANLTEVKGIGRWTAEMFLIFNLLRPDVFPVGDVGLQRAVSLHYADGTALTLAALKAHGERWRPWRSVATWYLWRSLDPIPVDY